MTDATDARRKTAYQPWLDLDRNAPRLTTVDEPLSASLRLGPGPALAAKRGDNSDLTINAGGDGEAIGQRIIITGTVTDRHGDPVRGAFIEIWQANAAGRYNHELDSWNAPLDPNFGGNGWTHTDEQGRYAFTTIKPGNYPWRIETNEWRPAHVHFSVLGPALADRLVTQLYFPDDPLFDRDSIYQGLDPEVRSRVVCTYDHDLTVPDWAMGFRFDMVLRGPHATPSINGPHHDREQGR